MRSGTSGKSASLRCHGAARRGMTLLELLIVMGLIGVLLGAGVGLVASVDVGHRAAKGLVQSVIRAARNSSVARGAPSRVVIDRARRTIRADAFEVVGTWHFEGGTEVVRGAFEIDGINQGALLVDDGFTGRALSFEPGSRGRAEVPVQLYSAYDLTEGFRLEFALRLDGASGGRVLRIGESVGVDVSSEGAMRVWLVPRAQDSFGGELRGGRASLEAPAGTFAAGRWRRVSFHYDRRGLVLEVDGVRIDPPEDSEPEMGPVWRIDGPLVIGDAQGGFTGSIDALVLSVIGASESTRLPDGVEFSATTPAQIAFDGGGNLDRSVHREPVRFSLEQAEGRSYAIVVGLYGTVE
ncbi:MAG: prepilin-type N-terminal cleavage/methylation domain-containing protein [Planctomycetes bacterium]|nr:prepilin-type N-terminal cleavage/methylation domain-containing protein [Planctomycetota bacterium]